MGSIKISQLYQHVNLLLEMLRKHLTGGHLQLVYFSIYQSIWCYWSWQLLEKLDHYGIWGIIKILLKSYLTLHSQSVEITTNDNKYPMNNYNSTPRNIKYGIPQGSILDRFCFYYT
jgi:hypothetical protein